MRFPQPAATLAVTLLLPSAGRAEWPQWGGPARDFRVATEVAPRWPEKGPAVRWQRPLDDGYSGVAVADGLLVTMGRRGDSEVVIAASLESGETLWTHEYPAPLPGWMRTNHGVGPRSTPLLAGGRVFTVGIMGTMFCLDRAGGAVLWRRDLVTGLGGTRNDRGYASSPLSFGDTVIVPVGGDGQALVAFRQSDGEVAWKSGDFDRGLSSPMLVRLGGRTQVVALLNAFVAGFDPASGRELWKHPHGGRGERNVSVPVFDGTDGLLFVSSAYGGGSRVVRLVADGEAVRVEELWADEQVRVMFTNALRIGDHVYASSGDFGPVPLTALDVKTGAVAWRDRTFARLSMVQVGERVLVLDETGALGLVSLSPKGLEVHARVQLREDRAWTPPSVVGRRAYVRTRTELIALELP